MIFVLVDGLKYTLIESSWNSLFYVSSNECLFASRDCQRSGTGNLETLRLIYLWVAFRSQIHFGGRNGDFNMVIFTFRNKIVVIVMTAIIVMGNSCGGHSEQHIGCTMETPGGQSRQIQ